LGFSIAGRVVYQLGVSVTAILNGFSVGLVGSGVVGLALHLKTTRARGAVLVGAPALCLAGLGIAGMYAVNGYADLLWASAATAAVVYGLVLPHSKRYLVVAWVSAAVAAFTKNEGLVAALIIVALMVFRYSSAPGPSPKRWWRRAVRSIAFALPLLMWVVATRLEGVGNNFFGPSTTTQSIGLRLGLSVARLSSSLHIVPAAVAVVVLGSVVLSATRRRAGIANPAWLWIALGVWLAALLYTYAFGNLEIRWWLRTSAARTSIFPQLLLLTELVTWAVLACESPASPTDSLDAPRESQRSRSTRVGLG
jgi:hypothetical protein